ncbi:hypothetical protein HYC85_019194 [Camellia sinensis]|uniref:J domain-containing protein n=1 Tax=Camellia sinensis TaxID=4442 RepID=A0A7J7GL51_CAMSI|nr:hypothetical protein HYC85_019194 [Camellia sinensis]
MEDKFDDDHYVILGLPYGEEGAKLSEKEITKAYRKRALEIHPDKRPDHRNAYADIQRLNASYAILKDEKARKDTKLRIRRQSSQQGSKRRKTVNDLEEIEKASEAKAREEEEEEEERIHRKFKEEVTRIRAKQGNRVGPIGIGLEKEKVMRG